MKFHLTNDQKEKIVLEYGSSIKSIDTAINVLNELELVEDYEEFIELICSIALDVEVMKDMKGSALKRRNLSEIIAATVAFKYKYSDVISEGKSDKVRVFLNGYEN